MDEEGIVGCFGVLAILGALFYCFPILMTVITCTIIIIGVWAFRSESKENRKKFLTDLQSEIPQKLRITKNEVIYDFGEKGESSWKYEDFRIFTSRGEFIVKIKDVDKKDIELEQVSDVDFMKESKQ
ncbi:hypothetical protein SIM22_04745 [Bacillus cereus group sp. BfR-BA-01363]|uniref:hypothetical protein n=1 Tax=Bacillus cereus group sp. BfR-BA-01363 TaxID=3094882 RepID=UPI0029C546ED|nr:hypothetical protein [Bacillus cereus group sp. BfR-BA-01363]MDX5853438.1 hypothetical protein [Bacillus cereus group sp. BfR-BA-01363]